MSAPPVLVSHALCPYVQRAAIVLAEKGVAFERRDVDLAHKPDWFTRLSPTGKTPMLLVQGQALFESAAICEYLDDTVLPRLHPAEALQRARHRGWMEFGSGLLGLIAAFYNAADEAALQARGQEIRARLQTLEDALGDGPFFAGASFSLVDAVFAPVFRYLDNFERLGDFGLADGLPRLQAWRAALATRPSVREAAHPDHAALLQAFIAGRPGALGQRALNAREAASSGPAGLRHAARPATQQGRSPQP